MFIDSKMHSISIRFIEEISSRYSAVCSPLAYFMVMEEEFDY